MLIYDTAQQTKREFEPLVPGRVKMYVCGPTVYDLLHVGNFRGPIVFHMVRQWLEYRGFEVDFIYNYTDVDDKIIARATRDQSNATEVAVTFTAEFERDFARLGLRPHSRNPRVTEFMNPIVALIETLIGRGHAYALDGSVYFDVKSKADYGKLSRKDVDDLTSGVRIDVNSAKKNPADFALWKKAKPGEPAWDSPWGPGRPGWHIECSAMAREILGDTIDIHGGGLDLLFPHHENECAQSEAATGHSFVRYWMHNNMLNFGSQKMSKSLGNIRTARSFMDEYHPEILKHLMLSAHYRSVLDFTPGQIEHIIAAVARIYSALALAEKVAEHQAEPKLPADVQKVFDEARAGIERALDDDFNTPEALARLFEATRVFNQIVRVPGKITPRKSSVAKAYRDLAGWLGGILALFGEPPAAFLTVLDDMLLLKKGIRRSDVEALVAERGLARAARDWSRSDELRNKLVAMGIAVQDGTEGSEWEVAK